MSFSSLISLWRLSCHVSSKSQKLPSDVKGKPITLLSLKQVIMKLIMITIMITMKNTRKIIHRLFFPLKYAICAFFLL